MERLADLLFGGGGSSVGRGDRGVGDWLRGLIGLNVVGLLGVAVVDLLAHLLGEGQLNGGAVGGSELGDALLDDGDVILDLGDGDALVLDQVLAGDDGQGNGLVNAGLDGFRVGNSDRHINRGDNGDIVGSFLGNFFAVVVTITMVPVAMSRLADCDHLDVSLLFKSDLNSFGGSVFSFLGIGV